jgi:hypothetical protein
MSILFNETDSAGPLPFEQNPAHGDVLHPPHDDWLF